MIRYGDAVTYVPEARRTGEDCGLCREPTPRPEPVWVGTDSYAGLRVPICWRCAGFYSMEAGLEDLRRVEDDREPGYEYDSTCLGCDRPMGFEHVRGVGQRDGEKAGVCSNRCYSRASKRERRPEKELPDWCPQCGQRFPSNLRADAKYCSTRCRVAAHRRTEPMPPDPAEVEWFEKFKAALRPERPI